MFVQTKRELSEWLPVSERQVHNLFRKGVFPTHKGKKGYNLKKMIECLYYYALQQNNGGQDPDDQDDERRTLEAERIRLTAAQADKAELDVSIQRRELVPINEIIEYLEDMVLRCKGKLLALPSRLSPQLLSQDDLATIEDTMRAGVIEALQELSEDWE